MNTFAVMKEKARQSITQYRFKTDLALEFEIVSIKDLVQKRKTLLTLPHRTDFYHILWVEKGTAKHEIDFQTVQVKNNSILFIGKGKVHLFDADDKYDGSLILFTDNFFCRNDDDRAFLRSTILFNDFLETTPLQLDGVKVNLSILLSLMKDEWASFANRDVLQNYLHNFLLLSDRAKRSTGFKEVPKGADRDYALLFVSLVDEHFVSVKTAKAYADMIHIPEKRLARAVTNILGKTPKAVINDRVLLEVKRLLVHTNQSIKEIGYMLGFPEPTNFIKYFKQQVGITPSEFDGPTSITDETKTEENKKIVQQFVDDILVNGKMDKLAGYFNGDNYIQHNPQIPDQLSGLGKTLAELGKQGISLKYDKIHKVLGEGNFVLVVSEGHFGKSYNAFYDLFRVENGKIAEHWDVIEPIPAKENWKNNNGEFGF